MEDSFILESKNKRIGCQKTTDSCGVNFKGELLFSFFMFNFFGIEESLKNYHLLLKIRVFLLPPFHFRIYDFLGRRSNGYCRIHLLRKCGFVFLNLPNISPTSS